MADPAPLEETTPPEMRYVTHAQRPTLPPEHIVVEGRSTGAASEIETITVMKAFPGR
ncbi:hypothetical protein ACYJ1Y_13320 [Natrialbaceae archaeon A-gly3]